MSDLSDPRNPWAAAIGRVFVAFGSIEFITLMCLDRIPKDRIKRSTSSFKLVQRIELIQELLEAHQGKFAQALTQQLERAKQLAPTRNLIAHNPIFVDVFHRNDGSLYYVQSLKSALKQNKALSLEQVEKFADEAEALVADLYKSSHEVFDSLREGVR